MASLGHYGEHAAKDPLFVGPHAFDQHYEPVPNNEIFAAMKRGMKFIAPKRLRFRREQDFYLVNIRWGNTISISDETAEFLIRHRDSGEAFSSETFGPRKSELLASLFYKDVIVAEDPSLAARFGGDERDKQGLSMNFENLKLAG